MKRGKMKQEEKSNVTFLMFEGKKVNGKIISFADNSGKMDLYFQGGGENTKNRDEISSRLLSLGFKEGGSYSTSSVFRWKKNRRGWKLSWGKKCNIGGRKATKYFTLYKYFKSKRKILEFLKEL